MTWFYRHPHGDAYYNEFDEGAAAWLRELMRANLIAPGVIDTRSILEVRPLDLIGFTQCHFFAGIGGWSYALRLAGWPDDRPVWTGSPPCQPFSVAGQDKGKDDERHLAPHFIDLVRAARPAVLFGEQVASAAVFGRVAGKAKRDPTKAPDWAWLDDLSDRLEAAHYAVGASDIPAAGIGAPHIRQRTFFGACDLRFAPSRVDDNEPQGWAGGELRSRGKGIEPGPCGGRAKPDCSSSLGGLVNGIGAGLEGHGRDGRDRNEPGWDNSEPNGSAGAAMPSCGMGHNSGPSPLDGFWANADWLGCRDGKWRPVEPGTFPLADGLSGRVGQLRGYGNAINPWAAKEFIEAFEGARFDIMPFRVMSEIATDNHGVFG